MPNASPAFPPGPSDALSSLLGLPEGVDPAQKYGFGLWDDGALVAFTDILRGYPRPDTASMGLLIVRGDLHRRGFGMQLHDQLAVTAKGWPEITTMRLGVIATAPDSEPFWRALGYLPTGEVKPYRYDRVESTVAVWERPVAL